MSEWITDRRPTENDADVHNNVYNRYGVYTHWVDIDFGEPWMRTNRPEPYVKPKRYTVKLFNIDLYKVIAVATGVSWATVWVRDGDYERAKQAAERIAAIYEEVMP